MHITILLRGSENMTLDEAIKHCKEKACGNSQCNQEHKQLADWLKELKEYQEKIRAALYEVELLHKKIEPSENSNIDRHIKNIIWILKGN